MTIEVPVRKYTKIEFLKLPEAIRYMLENQQGRVDDSEIQSVLDRCFVSHIEGIKIHCDHEIQCRSLYDSMICRIRWHDGKF